MRKLINTDEINEEQVIKEISIEDSHGNVYFEVDLPFNTIEIKWSDNKKFLHLYLFGPDGRLYGQMVGVGAEGSRIISIYQEANSPCCLSPDLNSKFNGEWRLEYKLPKNNDNTLKVKILAYELSEAEEENNWQEENIVRFDEEDLSLGENKEWYCGDFHTHTIYSDGKMTREENNEIAKERGLDFYCPTDHNIFHYHWPKSDKVLIVPGTEITSSFGHVNLLFSSKNPFEMHSIEELEDEDSFLNLINEAKDYSLPVINHPFMPPWDFLAKKFPLKEVKYMEIINDPTYPSSKEASEKALKAWNYMLNEGYKVVGIGGSDSHLKPDEKYQGASSPSILGNPRTFIQAEKNSDYYLKSGLARADVSLSRNALIRLEFPELQRDNLDFSGKINLRAILGEEEYLGSKLSFYWILDGEVLKTDQAPSTEIELEIDSNYHWIRVDVRDEEKNLYGFTNPVFFNTDKSEPIMQTWGDLMRKINEEN